MINPLDPFRQPTPASGTGQAKGGAAFRNTMQSSLDATPPDVNPFSPEAFENRMNTWLVDMLQRQNAARLQVYNRALEDWKLNDARYRQLGMTPVPPPPPPKLEVAEAKPAGWWFRTDNAKDA